MGFTWFHMVTVVVENVAGNGTVHPLAAGLHEGKLLGDVAERARGDGVIHAAQGPRRRSGTTCTAALWLDPRA